MTNTNSRREVYKALKKHKLFSKYCLCVSNAYMKYPNPRSMLADYENAVFKNIDLREFIEVVRSAWYIGGECKALIQS